MAGRSVSHVLLLHFKLIVAPRLTGCPQGPNLSSAVADGGNPQVAAIVKMEGATAGAQKDAFMSAAPLGSGREAHVVPAAPAPPPRWAPRDAGPASRTRLTSSIS